MISSSTSDIQQQAQRNDEFSFEKVGNTQLTILLTPSTHAREIHKIQKDFHRKYLDENGNLSENVSIVR
jgi:hypothetical protein